MAEWFHEEKDRVLQHLSDIAGALTRQADVMERDVEGEQLPKDIDEALQKQFSVLNDRWISFVQNDLASELNKVITATYLSDMHRARAVREFQQKLANFEGIKHEEYL